MRVRISLAAAVCIGLFACQTNTDKAAAEKKATKSVDASAKPVTTTKALKPEPPKTIPAPPDVAAPPDDAVKTESGLASKVLKPGDGKTHPAATDNVKVHYTGWTTDGKMFDSSRTFAGSRSSVSTQSVSFRAGPKACNS